MEKVHCNSFVCLPKCMFPSLFYVSVPICNQNVYENIHEVGFWNTKDDFMVPQCFQFVLHWLSKEFLGFILKGFGFSKSHTRFPSVRLTFPESLLPNLSGISKLLQSMICLISSCAFGTVSSRLLFSSDFTLFSNLKVFQEMF